MNPNLPVSPTEPSFSRRDFLRLAGVTAAGLLVGGCSPAAAPTGKPTDGAQARVAIGRAASYEPAEVERQLAEMLDLLGGLGDVVRPGDRVAIKVNLTGGVNSGRLAGLSPEESFVTHPAVAQALVKRVQAAGAKEVFLVEAVYEWESYQQWGYEAVAAATGAQLVDLNQAHPFADFVEAVVGPNPFIYDAFRFNPLLTDIDVFMSLSKMKNHYLAGVTHTMKNLYGLVPYRFYRRSANDQYRSGFHGAEAETRTRLPRIIVDLNRARPIHFSLVDGILTTQGGEGPWISTLAPIQPRVLVAGKNPVATDAVATALMGHDPQGEYPEAPYLRCDNHLNLAAAAGLGTNDLSQIEVVGAALDEARTPFSPAW